MDLEFILNYITYSWPQSIVVGVFLVLFLLRKREHRDILEILGCLVTLFASLILIFLYQFLFRRAIDSGSFEPSREIFVKVILWVLNLTILAGYVLLILAFAKQCWKKRPAQPPPITGSPGPGTNPYL